MKTRETCPARIILARIVEPNRGDTLSRFGLIQGINQVLDRPEMAVVTRRNTEELPANCSPLAIGYLRNLIPTWPELKLLLRGRCAVLWTCGHDYTDEGSAFKALHVLLRCVISRCLGAKFFVVAQGAGPIKRSLTQWSIRMLGRCASYISMRDPESYALVKGMLREKDRAKLHLTSDSALLASLALKPLDEMPERPVVGMNLRQWFHLHFAVMPYDFLWGTRKKDGAAPELGAEMQAMLANFAALADHCVERHGARVLFVPMYPPGRQDWEIDDRLARMVIDRMRHPEAASIHTDDDAPQSFLRVFQSLSAMVGVRLHSTIVATVCGVPSLHVTYSPKGRSYYKLLGEDRYVLDIRDVACEGGDATLIERFDALWNERDAYAQRLREAMPRLIDSALEPVRALEAALRGTDAGGAAQP